MLQKLVQSTNIALMNLITRYITLINMNSPAYTFPSDISTPKPEQIYRHEDFNKEDFNRYLTSLVDDINALGRQTESLRSENQLLQKQLELSEKEKEKHINLHAREIFELKKVILAQAEEKKGIMRELKYFRERVEEKDHRGKVESGNGLKEYSSEKVLRGVKTKGALDIKGKISQMEKDQKLIKKKIRDLETSAGNKSGVIRWNTEF